MVWVGNVPLMRRVGASVSDDVQAALKAHGDKAETVVMLAVADTEDDGHGPVRVEAVVAVSSKVKLCIIGHHSTCTRCQQIH
jgi:hypothetical protein